MQLSKSAVVAGVFLCFCAAERVARAAASDDFEADSDTCAESRADCEAAAEDAFAACGFGARARIGCRVVGGYAGREENKGAIPHKEIKHTLLNISLIGLR